MDSISRTPSIYQIRHNESGKVYVGSAADPCKRCKEHRNSLLRKDHHSRYLQRAWDKYGEDAFVFEIIEPVLFVEDLIVREQYWLDNLHAADPKFGYNTAHIAGSQLGLKRSEDFRAAQSARMKARFSDPAARAKVAERQRARYADPDNRAKMSAKAKERSADNSAITKARWADPTYRDAVSAQIKAVLGTADAFEKLSKASKAQWANPDRRAKASAQGKTMWEDPAYRAKQKKTRSGD